MTATEKLQSIIDGDPRRVSRTAVVSHLVHLSKPFRIGQWLCATDGHGFAGILTDEPGVEMKQAGVVQFGTSLLPLALKRSVRPLSELLAILGPAPAVSACKRCDGSGLVLCSACGGEGETCEVCHQSGTLDCACGYKPFEQVPVQIGNLIYDANLVRRFLTIADDGEFGFVESLCNPSAINSSGRPLILGGAAWRVLVMPLRAEKAQARFELETDGEVIA